jgi:putative peptidoglycan lipid II flippase
MAVSIKKLLTKSKDLMISPKEPYGYIAFAIAMIGLVTKVSGVLKYQILTAVYGVRSTQLDIFNGANTIPEFIYLIIAIGSINAALVPIFTQTSINEDENRLKQVFSSIVNIFFLILLVICILVFIFAPQIINGALGIHITNTEVPLGPAEIAKFTQVLRILIFSPIILCISSIFACILQIKHRFFITTLSPMFYNLGIILTTIFLVPHFNNDIAVLAIGVLLGSILHFAVQAPAILKAEIKYSPFILNLKDKYVRKAIKQTLPRTIGLTTDYIGNIFQTLLALRLMPGTLNSFKLAISLREIPATMFGIAIAQSVFPGMSELGSKKDFVGLQNLFSKALRIILFWSLPITAIFIVLRTPIVQLVFGIFSGKVDFNDTSLISYSLLFLSFGVIFYSVLGLVNRTFYALDDSKTPTIISICVILLELALTYSLANLFSHFSNLSLNPLLFWQNFDNFFTNGGEQAAIGGIALASSISILINLILLIKFLKAKGINTFFQPQHIYKKFISTLVMLVTGLLAFQLFVSLEIFNNERVLGVFLFTVNVGIIMCLSYYFVEKILKDDDLEMLQNPISKLKTGLWKIRKVLPGSKITVGP